MIYKNGPVVNVNPHKNGPEKTLGAIFLELITF